MKIILTQNRNLHRPLHIYNGHTYFVSARCLHGKKYLVGNVKKKILQSKIGEIAEEMNIGILAWSILENHYHVLFLLKREESAGVTRASVSQSTYDRLAPVTPKSNKEKLVIFITRLHSISSLAFNKIDQTPRRQIWHQYWDYCIRNIPDFWKHFNYIIEQPFKHGLVRNLEEAYTYPFSSNPIWLKRFGKEGVGECFVKYPIKEWVPRDCE